MGKMSELQIELTESLRTAEAECGAFRKHMRDGWELDRLALLVDQLTDSLKAAADALHQLKSPAEEQPERLAWDEGSHEWVCPNCRQNEFTQIVEGESSIFIWSHNRHYMVEARELGDWSVTGRKEIRCDNCDQIVLLPATVEMIEHGEEVYMDKRHAAGDPSEPGHPLNPRSEY